MSAPLQLFRKDFRLLLRGRGLLVMLIGYPLIVAALVTVALQSGERKPAIAFVNLDTSNRTVRVGDQRLGVKDYEARLAKEVDLKHLSADEARRALEEGRVSAVLTLPEGFISDLQSGIRSPTIGLEVNRRSPIEAQSISRRLEAAVARLNQELAGAYVAQTLDLVRIIIEGGDVAIFTREGNVLGLKRSEQLVRQVQATLTKQGQRALARRLDPLLNFIVEAGVNLDLANDAATAISQPITLKVPDPPTGREPLSAFGFAGALLVEPRARGGAARGGEPVGRTGGQHARAPAAGVGQPGGARRREGDVRVRGVPRDRVHPARDRGARDVADGRDAGRCGSRRCCWRGWPSRASGCSSARWRARRAPGCSPP